MSVYGRKGGDVGSTRVVRVLKCAGSRGWMRVGVLQSDPTAAARLHPAWELGPPADKDVFYGITGSKARPQL